MANQEHLKHLRQGGLAWNAWREEQPPGFRPDLNFADLSRVNLNFADLIEADLRIANLSGAKLGGANLNGADLSGANLSGASLIGAKLSGANLSGADLSGAYPSGAKLTGADLIETGLRGADLRIANLSGANLSGAKLYRADLSGAKLYRADFAEAIVARTTFNDVDLRGVKGLETVVHEGPSSIGIDTIYRSQGSIPETFLKGAGVDDTFITYIRSLVGKAIEYYTCFISYSSKDQDFAERLYADLQSKGVRCWFAPEDLKIGEKFWHRIDESIRLYDKLLVVLSQHSVQSEWVEREVMAALEKERQQKRVVLFPITLDEAFKQTDAPWAADIRRSRHTGNFVRWKRHDDYQKGLERLLRDLQATAQ